MANQTETKQGSSGTQQGVNQQNMIERIHSELSRLNPESLERVERFIKFERNEPPSTISQR